MPTIDEMLENNDRMTNSLNSSKRTTCDFIIRNGPVLQNTSVTNESQATMPHSETIGEPTNVGKKKSLDQCVQLHGEGDKEYSSVTTSYPGAGPKTDTNGYLTKTMNEDEKQHQGIHLIIKTIIKGKDQKNGNRFGDNIITLKQTT